MLFRSVAVIAAGQERTPEPEVAGDYAVVDGRSCLGAAVQVAQSGRFIRFGNAQGTLGGELEVDDGSLAGEVSCEIGCRSFAGSYGSFLYTCGLIVSRLLADMSSV